jgi:ATP-dependent helicase HrpB
VVDRTAQQLVRLMQGAGRTPDKGLHTSDAVSRLLLSAFPERIGKRREDSDGRFVLSQGRGVRLPHTSGLSRSQFIIAVNVDAGEKGEGIVHSAADLTEELIRQECAGHIDKVRRVEWDKRESRIISTLEERLGAVLLSSKPFQPADEETAPLLCEAIRSNPGMLGFSKEARQLQARAALIRKAFPEEAWPDLSDEYLLAAPETWLLPWLCGIRSAQALAALDLLPALKALLSWEQQRLLEDRAPTHLLVPSGNRVALDYTQGETPVLAVKLQEMFGLADTPVIADGRIKALLHLLSPARRPVQITQDLKTFWNSGYQQVKKELKGRYPKHPWPDDPWNAVPTRKTKRHGR